MSRAFDPAERIQTKRHFERLRGWAATVLLAVALSVLCALLLEAVLVFIVVALGAMDWHRGWIDDRFTKTIAWLQGMPVLGIVFGGIARLKDWFPANSSARDIVVLAITAYPLAVWAAARVGPALVARYDDETPSQPAPDPSVCAGLAHLALTNKPRGGDCASGVWAKQGLETAHGGVLTPCRSTGDITHRSRVGCHVFCNSQ